MALTSLSFKFDPRVRGYREIATGRLYPWEKVRTELDHALANAETEARALGVSLKEGRMSLATFERSMHNLIRASHGASAVLAKGGHARMSAADWGKVGREVRTQLDFLRNFSNQVASGKQLLNGTLPIRAGMYMDAARGTYHAMETREAIALGYDRARRILAPGDHCPGCVKEAKKGWRPVAQVPRIGSQHCRVRCKCHIRYKSTASGATFPY